MPACHLKFWIVDSVIVFCKEGKTFKTGICNFLQVICYKKKTNVNVPRKQYEVINISIVAYVVIYTKCLRDLDSTLVKVARGLLGASGSLVNIGLSLKPNKYLTLILSKFI